MELPVSLLLIRGMQLNNRIVDTVKSLPGTRPRHAELILSFDLYCLLMEYFILLYHRDEGVNESLYSLLSYDDLEIQVGSQSLKVSVDFFAPINSLHIK